MMIKVMKGWGGVNIFCAPMFILVHIYHRLPLNCCVNLLRLVALQAD